MIAPTFAATCSANDAADALARVAALLGRCAPGLETSGRAVVRSERHRLYDVEVLVPAGYTKAQRNDAWVVLTSYGVSPSADLGSTWESVLGASA